LWCFAEIQTDGPRQAQLAAILGIAWLRFAGYLQLAFLQRTVRMDTGSKRKVGYARSGLVGASFAAGWTPCIGPVLGSIFQLGLASSSAWTATYLMVAYSAGLAVPFIIVALTLGDIAPALRRISRYAPYIEVATGVMLIGVGVLLWTERLIGLNQFFNLGKFSKGL
jgi:cytochrome c-type biogenesis protein